MDTPGGDTPGSTVLPRGGVNTSYASSKEAGGIRGRGKPDGGLLSAAQGQVVLVLMSILGIRLLVLGVLF